MLLLQAGMQHYFGDGMWSIPVMSVSTGPHKASAFILPQL